jgi:alcohol dehydrogenase class IV
MNVFRYFQPTEIRFGRGRIKEVGDVVARYGKRCLLVSSGRQTSPLMPACDNIRTLLERAGVAVEHFDGVLPNPTTTLISEGAVQARAFRADVIVGLGGGSAMDTAKAIAVEATHPGTAWDYRFFKSPQPDDRTLPIVAISTTSGTGSQVTQVAVLSNPEERDKSAIYNEIVYPRVAIVDPELMLTAPPRVTAATGFDAFAHSFESYLHPNASPYTDLMALEAIRLVVRTLPLALADGARIDARVRLAWADTLAGLCIAAAGVTLPHGIGMAMGGLFPHVAHGEALALVYPGVLRFSSGHASERFATLARTIDPSLADAADAQAAAACVSVVEDFLARIQLRLTLRDLEVPVEQLPVLARQSLVLPDYRNHPRLATEADVLELLEQCC